MGNVLVPVSGTIIVIDAQDATEEEREAARRSGPRFPRPHLQRLDTEPVVEITRSRRIAQGSTPPPIVREGESFEEAVTEVNTPRPTLRATTAS